MALKDVLKEIISKYPQKAAIQTKETSGWIDVSYQGLNKQIISLASWMHKEGLEKTDRIAVILNNRKEWPAVFFAAQWLGIAVVPINSQAPKKEIENILKDNEPKLVFTDNANIGSFIKKVILIDSEIFKEAVTNPQINNRDEIQNISIDDSDLACILYTSGTTNEPKGVMLTQENLLANYYSLSEINLLTNKDRVLSILPLYHAYPLMGTLILPLLCGASIVYSRSLQGEDILEAAQKTNITKFVAVPQILYLFHRKINGGINKIFPPFRILLKLIIEILWFIRKVTRLNLSKFIFSNLHRKFGKNLDFFITGGARIDRDIEEEFFKLGFTVIEGYGLTETSPVLTLSPITKPKIGSVGKAIKGVEVALCNKDAQGIGEVIAKGPNIMQGYYKRPDLTSQVIKGDWFFTGDLGFFDKEGYLFLTGRVKDIIVLSSGLKVYPEEIEKHYLKSPFIKEICIFEVKSKEGSLEKSDILYAVIVPDLEYFKKLKEVNVKLIIKERLEDLSKELPAYKRVMGFVLTHQPLVRTALGKVKRYAVREMYLNEITKQESDIVKQKELLDEDKIILQSNFNQQILSYLKKQTNTKRDIHLDDGLEIDLGIDSLGRIELASGLKASLGIEVKDDVMADIFTVRDLLMQMQSLVLDGRDAINRVSTDSNYWKNIINILPKKENLEKIDLNPGLISWLAAFLFSGFCYFFFKVFYRLKIEGKENIPRRGPYILYANHTSYFDGLIVEAAAPLYAKLDLFFVGFRAYFDVPVIRNLIKVGRIIPLDFSSYLLEALRSGFYVLRNKKSLSIFPEGMRSSDGKLREFKKGFGILAKESQAKLIPVLIEGSWQAWPRTSKFPKLFPIKIKFRKPLEPQILEKKGFEKGAKDAYEAICIGAKLELEGSNLTKQVIPVLSS